MLRIGLTGGIGAGKSTAAAAFARRGALVIDSDLLAREVVRPGSPGLGAIRERFGRQAIGPDGALDRPALGRLVFADPVARADLEAITHPLIAARTAELMESAPPETVVVHDVPLLVEKSMGAAYHLVVVVGADAELRVERVMAGRGTSLEDARSRVAAQADDAQRRPAADVWLDNGGEPGALDDAVDALWHQRVRGYENNLRTGGRSRRPDALALVAYDPTWPAAAQRLVDRITYVLGERAASVDHIGSTSIPGMLGKDVIDLQVGVRDLADADDPDFVDALQRKGFPRVPDNVQDQVHAWAPEPVPWAKRFHGSADPGRIAHVHIRRVGSAGWLAALAFRDRLRSDSDAAAAYRAHKLAVAASTTVTSEYATAKARWFEPGSARAGEWAMRPEVGTY